MLKYFAIMTLFLSATFAAEYNVDTDAKNSVKFISDAPIEEFEGTTSSIDGYLDVKGSDFTSENELYFEVDINNITTGIGLRDRHMRENYLETDKHPLATFSGKITKATKNGENWDVTVEGDFEIHGVKNKMTIDGKMTKEGDSYKITSNYSVALSDHKIEVPSVMFKKIDENMAVELVFFVKKV
jgi:polyisoprenoid-binding protein YceI